MHVYRQVTWVITLRLIDFHDCSQPDNRFSLSSSPSPVLSVEITSSLKATRSNGTAPLAVLFDATGTTATPSLDTFRQLRYTFNFGDERGLTWSVSGQAKNIETSGPIAAHVFDLPGTYIVGVTATDITGSISTTSVTITVADPGIVYAGTKTICVSAKSDYNGCPSGASQQTKMPSTWSGKRVLFHRGEGFGDIQILDGNSGVQVGAYGSGTTKPVVGSIGVGNWRPATANFADDIVVMDLAVSNGMDQSVSHRVLFYRNDVKATNGGIQMSLGGECYWARDDPWRIVDSSAFTNAHEIFFVENMGINSDITSSSYGVFGYGSRVAMLGNRFGSQKFHSMRLTSCDRCAVLHNELQGISDGGNYHSLKIHSGGLKPYEDKFINCSTGGGWASAKIVVSNNLISNAVDNNAWSVAIAPQNGEYVEGIENVIVGNNKFVRGINVNEDHKDLTMGGRFISYRSNSVIGKGFFTTGIGHDEALPSTWKGPYFNDSDWSSPPKKSSSSSGVVSSSSSSPSSSSSGILLSSTNVASSSTGTAPSSSGTVSAYSSSSSTSTVISSSSASVSSTAGDGALEGSSSTGEHILAASACGTLSVSGYSFAILATSLLILF